MQALNPRELVKTAAVVFVGMRDLPLAYGKEPYHHFSGFQGGVAIGHISDGRRVVFNLNEETVTIITKTANDGPEEERIVDLVRECSNGGLGSAFSPCIGLNGVRLTF